ncbi:CaiB/BaiF CoA transferase family protein [Sphingorhabdus sp. 109]|jgi:crotonobetainyl-CoA:carnitine CoA-transferase CaiB-like acyl-CoA transferase|uniref:CaiB/BaiF CoA transferase family protein n=1 Tax=Sphingorhabdus sp. 109 TaxID=2653173 RepID=UPI0012EEE870|nr:CoA transferase [Sphingorhabdus sp. 109]VWX59768.1 Acetyl-CoA:oxalate CoA-transferase [Sphingorhabdus sp. 109]
MGKLSGIKVIDLSLFLPGPMLTMMMADHGAEVIKVEPPTGDPARAMEPVEAGQSVWFRNLNRGKQALALDLKSDEGRERLWQLLADADVMIEGFRPGVMKRLGFDYDAVAAKNPRIVYCSVSAFGQEGEMAHHPAHDLAVQALSGFLSVNDGPDGMPVVPGVPSADMAAGLNGLSAVLMALIGREKSGKGDYVDIAMFDAMLPWCAHIAGEAIQGGNSPTSRTQRSLGGAAFYNVYRTADGLHVVLGGREVKFAKSLLTALDRTDLLPLAEMDAGEMQQALTDFLRETFATKSRDQWVAWFADKDVAFSPVLDFREALDQDFVREKGLLVEAGGSHQIAPAFRFRSDEKWQPSDAPELSE